MPYGFSKPGPEFWDSLFRPRGPLGLFSGRTAMGFIPGLSQGLEAVDLKQSLKEGDALGIGGGLLGMIPGGRLGKMGIDAGDRVIDIAKARAKRPPKPKPPGEPSAEVFSPEVLEQYRNFQYNYKARKKLKDFNYENSDTSLVDGIRQGIEQYSKVSTSVDDIFKRFLKPGKLKHGTAKDLRSDYLDFQEALNAGEIPVEVLEEAEAVLGALDDVGSITTTDQVKEFIKAILARRYNK